MSLFAVDDIVQTVKIHEDETKYGAKDDTTFCNFFVRDVVESLVKQTRPELHALANQQFDNLVSSSDWLKQNFTADTKAVFEKSHAAASSGQLVIVAFRNSSDNHGHIAIVVPTNAMESSSAWGMKVPFIAQAGNKNPRNQPSEKDKSVFSSLKLSYGFSAAKRSSMEIFFWAS
jgi:hypothetical protein